MNRILSSLMVLMMSTILYSQPGVRREMIQDRIEAQRIAFITQKLQLTPDEATKFWPIYNEFKLKQKQLLGDAVLDRIEQQLGDGSRELSDAEAEKAIAEQFVVEEKMLALKKEYYQKLRSAIPPRKIALLNRTEMQFNRTVLEQIKERMQN